MITLAPTVTLWDAGEFITAAKVLGIPHPPGTPLFVLLGHVWGKVVAVGAYAWRLNSMSACFAAAGAGFFFLVAHRLLAGEAELTRLFGAAVGALLSAFCFTAWQNSNETEVYTVATFSIAAIAWLCVRWRDLRAAHHPRAPHLLLLIIYIAALSIGNHLLALLVGPAVSLFIFYTLRSSPESESDVHGAEGAEWGEWAVVTALWIVLIGVGLGSTALLIVGGSLFAGALIACVMNKSLAFPILAVLVAAIGVSIYGFLYIRAGQQPLLNEADPETWHNLINVIRRQQYGVRGVLDNPIFLHGPDNPGRNIRLIAYQFVNYFQYWSWQWGRALPLAGVIVITLLYTLLGVMGFDLARRDRGIFYLLGALWLVTGFGLVIYMNFKPGFSLFWDRFKTIDQHEVRERDYFFVMSFQVWGVLAGIGLARLLRNARPRRATVALASLVALLPFAFNFRPASRRQGPDATIARDFAYNLVQSVEPYGVLFTFGDNDTFPIWYLQEVEGIRQDVTLVNLSLANLDWYLRQLATRPTRPFDSGAAPPIYRAALPAKSPAGRPALPLAPEDIKDMQPVQIDRDATYRGPGMELPLRQGQMLRVADQVILFTIAEYVPEHRPVTFGVSSGRGSWLGLDPHLAFQGLAFKVVPRADTVKTLVRGIQATMVDTARTDLLTNSVFRFGKLFAADTLDLDPAAQQVSTSFSVPFLELGNAAAMRGDQRQAVDYLRRAYHLSPNPALHEIIQRIETQGVQSLFTH